MYVTDGVMLPTAYVIKNSTSVDYKQTTANFRRIFYIRYRPFESNLSEANPNLREPESVEDFGEFLWHGVGQETCEFFGCILAVTENPLNGHVDGTLTVHFELKL